MAMTLIEQLLARSAGLPEVTPGQYVEFTILRRLYFRARKLQAASESDESAIIARLTATATPTFVEFGFHPVEFNCVTLAKNPAW